MDAWRYLSQADKDEFERLDPEITGPTITRQVLS
ncbi:UNVERIFIED_ORG: hypothetical protein FHR35_003856 [Microbispora rosea subsp. rosea]